MVLNRGSGGWARSGARCSKTGWGEKKSRRKIFMRNFIHPFYADFSRLDPPLLQHHFRIGNGVAGAIILGRGRKSNFRLIKDRFCNRAGGHLFGASPYLFAWRGKNVCEKMVQSQL